MPRLVAMLMMLMAGVTTSASETDGVIARATAPHFIERSGDVGPVDPIAGPLSTWQSPLSRQNPLVGRIWLPSEGRFIDSAELVRRLTSADFVLLGERHDNVDHHRLQAWALEQIIGAGRRPVVAFEMIAPEQEPGLRRYLADHPGQAEGLDVALDWPAGQWPAWANYRPLFADALAVGMDIRPANVPLAFVRSLVRQQTVPPATLSLYRLDQPLDSASATALAREIRDAHCGQLPEQVVPGMVAVQRARDTAMALAMTTNTPTGAVLIAGAGHVRTDRGVPAQIAALAPGRRVFSLAFLEVAEGKDNPTSYGESWGTDVPPFDAVWFTPRTSDDDPCAAFAGARKTRM